MNIPQCIILELPHTQSMLAYMILTKYFWKFQLISALWEFCYDVLRPIDMTVSSLLPKHSIEYLYLPQQKRYTEINCSAQSQH